MRRGRQLAARKRELLELVEALDRSGWKAREIAEALCYSAAQIRNILAELGLKPRPITLEQRIEALPHAARRRVEIWRAEFCDSTIFDR